MVLHGTPVSPGFIAAKAYVYKTVSFEVPDTSFSAGEETKQMAAFGSALNAARAELDTVIAAFPPE